MTLAPHSRKKVCYYYDSKLFLTFIFLFISFPFDDAIKADTPNTVVLQNADFKV